MVVIDVSGNADVEIDKDGGASYTTGTESLTFNSTDWNSLRTVNVRAFNDSIDESLENLIATIMTNDASTTQDSYDAVDPSDVSVAVTDNDSSGVNLSKTNVSVTEGGANDSFTVVLSSSPEGSNVVVIDVSGNSDVEIDKNGGASYTTGTESLTFNGTDWDSPQTVTVRAFNDSIVESLENFIIMIMTNSGSTTQDSYDAVDPSDVSVEVTDND